MPDTSAAVPTEVAAFLAAHPQTQSVDIFFSDLSGVIRGKRYPVDQLAKVYEAGFAIAGSVMLLDATGTSRDPKGYGFSDGDPDALCKIIPGSLQPVTWATHPLGQAMISLENADGSPYPFDPRNVLQKVIDRFAELKLKPTIAFELEFYLLDPERMDDGSPQPPRSPLTHLRDSGTQVYSMDRVEGFSTLLAEVEAACEAQGVKTGAITAEYAPGQYEINLMHIDNPLLAADQCVMFKRAVQGVARKHGMQATFMAKPYLDQAGSGLHLHISLYDEEGRNVFDGGDEIASPMLLNAIGGVLELMPDSMGILAPNHNAYRRYVPNIFVPVTRSWDYENRSAAIRIPTGDPKARRIEHRIAGADTNPYLALATALAGVHYGITNKTPAPDRSIGNAGEQADPAIPFRLRRALDMLGKSEKLGPYLGAHYLETYAETKLTELDAFENEISPAEYRWYLGVD